MTRAELFRLFNECDNDKDMIQKRLKKYFNAPEGEAALADAPPHLLYDSDGAGKETTVDLVVDGLLKELRADG